MATSRLSKASPAVSHIIDKYAKYCPISLSIKDFTEFGLANKKGADNNACEKTSIRFLKKEIPVRLANIMKELYQLPNDLLTTTPIKLLSSWYETSFNDMLQFENADPENPIHLSEFTDTLNIIKRRHLKVVETMAHGVLEYRDTHGIKGDEQIQYFLDRFFMSRISVRMLINQHTLLFGSHLNDSYHPTGYVGCIDPRCNVLETAQDSYTEAKYLCDLYYSNAPDAEFECVNVNGGDSPVTLVYVPTHLYYILFEVFKNAMRAVVEQHKGKDLPKIRVTVCQGKEDVTIRISDRGGGFPRSLNEMLFHYMYSTAPKPQRESGSTSAPLAGYGYGLPISRLYARYFQGDLTVESAEGYGTEIYLYLKAVSSEANELLPVYNKKSSNIYKASRSVDDWSSRPPSGSKHGGSF